MSLPIYIQVIVNGRSQNIILQSGEQVILGRDTVMASGAEFNHFKVSREHAKIGFDDNTVWIEDSASTNGTFLNGEKLNVNIKYPIKPDDEISLAEVVTVRISNEQPPNLANQPKQKSEINIAFNASLNDFLKQKPELFIGRTPENDIALPDMSVSRRHARVFKENGKVYVEDLKSTNGTFVNGQRITDVTLLGETDRLHIGLHEFSLVRKAEDLLKKAAIAAHDITKIFPDGYQGLQRTSFEIPYQEMVALMGPSGCGKSTLLKALNGDSPPSSGSVRLFGLDLYENFELLKTVIGYVPQENVVHDELTVEKSLYYAARMRLSEDVSNERIMERVNEVLASLNINDVQIRATRVGNLSGGQKKRISIAVELLTQPKILFLDEPTSPLDPESIGEFLRCLRKLCEQGTTVIMVTHKPEDLEHADRIIFMGAKGHLVYDGSKDGFLGYFQKEKITEVYALLSGSAESREWYDKHYAGSQSESRRNKEIKPAQIRANLFHQSKWLTLRYFDIKFSDLRNLALLVLQPVLIALLIIAAFDRLIEAEAATGNIGALFIMAIAAIWFGVSNAAKEIVGETAIFRRERMFNLRLTPYIFSKLAVLTLLSSAQIFIFLLILFGYYDDLSAFMETGLFLLCVNAVSLVFGLMLSSVTSTATQVMSILPIALMPQIILAGIIQPVQNDVTLLLSYFTIGRWGTEGLARIQDSGSITGAFMDVIYNHLYAHDSFIASDGLVNNVFILFLLATAMLAIIYYFLLRK